VFPVKPSHSHANDISRIFGRTQYALPPILRRWAKKGKAESGTVTILERIRMSRAPEALQTDICAASNRAERVGRATTRSEEAIKEETKIYHQRQESTLPSDM
jgi:hypothetical protein